MSAHCWKGRRDWIEEQYGYHSPEHLETYDDDSDSTCMLPANHEGPHVWTDDADIGIKFE